MRRAWCGYAASPRRSSQGMLPAAGGAEGNRTPDLVIANDALSRLSYGPAESACGGREMSCQAATPAVLRATPARHVILPTACTGPELAQGPASADKCVDKSPDTFNKMSFKSGSILGEKRGTEMPELWNAAFQGPRRRRQRDRRQPQREILLNMLRRWSLSSSGRHGQGVSGALRRRDGSQRHAENHGLAAHARDSETREMGRLRAASSAKAR